MFENAIRANLTWIFSVWEASNIKCIPSSVGEVHFLDLLESHDIILQWL